MGGESLELQKTFSDATAIRRREIVVTLFGAVLNSMPVIFEISSATFTSKPFFVFRPYVPHQSPVSDTIWAYETYSANGSTALREHAQTWEGVLDTLNTVRELLDVATELLAEGKGCGILETCLSKGSA